MQRVIFCRIGLPKLASWLQQKGVVNASNVLGSPNNWKYLVFGLVLGFLEGRRMTEAFVAGLCASFILADGITTTTKVADLKVTGVAAAAGQTSYGVVVRNSSQSISPSPLSRWNPFLWLGRSSRNAAFAASSLR